MQHTKKAAAGDAAAAFYYSDRDIDQLLPWNWSSPPFVSNIPPYDPVTGEIKRVPVERQVEIVIEQMKACLTAAGSSLAKVIKW